MELSAAIHVIACAIPCVILVIIKWHMGRRRLYEAASKLDGPPVLPFIGNAYLLAGDNEALLNTVAGLTKAYPSPFRFWFGPRLAIFITDPAQLKAIYVSPQAIEKSGFYELVGPLFGNGLLTAPASLWRVHRKRIQPTFNSQILNTFVEVFSIHSRILANRFELNLDGSEFDVFDLLATASLDMLFETILGMKTGEERKSRVHYINALQQFATTIASRISRLWLYPDFIFKRTQLGKDQRRGVEIINDFGENMIQKQKIKNLRLGNQSDTANTGDCGSGQKPRREAFLDVLLKLSQDCNEFSEEQFRDEVHTMVAAGFETTAVTNSFVMLMLASHPEVQEKVYRELYDIYGDADVEEREVKQEDLVRMEYLERVIKETMRLFSLAPIIGRKLTDDVNIGEHTLPKDSEVIIPILEIHRRNELWPDPLRFDPDRFLPEEIAKRHPYSYLPFSAGPRNCIGLRYAMMTMKTLQAIILRRYILKKDNIAPIKDIRLRMDVVLKTVDPITIRIERRTRN